jgi:GNAT superfamily N-acetyltransferase
MRRQRKMNLFFATGYSKGAMRVESRAANAREVVDLRHAVLRVGLARETAVFPGDDAPTAMHFVAEEAGQIVGCVTLHLNSWHNEPAWQLRGMAVAPTHQSRGIGTGLLAAAEKAVVHAGANLPRLLWCNARVPASEFYRRHGWQVVSDTFDIPTAGPHVKMIKRL